MGGQIMEVYTALAYVLLGLILGTIGQGIRVIVGVKKKLDEISKSKNKEIMSNWFDSKRLLVSLFIGAVAGSLGAIYLLGTAVNKEFLLALVAVGYAGTDFIEGFIKSYLPKHE
jgi:hypothetical protein